jgi:hypothetical protein
MYNRAIEDPTGTSITIRAAGPEDVEALHRLAQRDSRPVPEGELLIALVDGEARAAISLASGETIADPFHRTEELVGMLTLRGSRLRGESRQRRRGLRRLLRSRGGGSLLHSPAFRGLFAHLTPEDEPKCATGKGTHSA